jgi:hypothetical protein
MKTYPFGNFQPDCTERTFGGRDFVASFGAAAGFCLNY